MVTMQKQKNTKQHTVGKSILMKKSLQNAGIFFVGFLLVGCSTVAVKQTFDLSTARLSVINQPKGAMRKPVQILITNPSALKTLDGQDIMVQNNSASISYLKNSQWADRLPNLVQARLVQAFEDTNSLAGVGRPGDGLAINYQIISDIRIFGINASHSPQMAEVEIAIKILDDRTGSVRATQIFKQQVAATGMDNDAYAKAMEAAFSEVVSQIVNWTISKV